jgi:ATP-dependent Lon protease
LVFPVGGIKEKVLAAHRAGMRRIVLPERNAADVEKIPEDVRRELDIRLVSRIREALDETLEKVVLTPPPPPSSSNGTGADAMPKQTVEQSELEPISVRGNSNRNSLT